MPSFFTSVTACFRPRSSFTSPSEPLTMPSDETLAGNQNPLPKGQSLSSYRRQRDYRYHRPLLKAMAFATSEHKLNEVKKFINENESLANLVGGEGHISEHSFYSAFISIEPEQRHELTKAFNECIEQTKEPVQRERLATIRAALQISGLFYAAVHLNRIDDSHNSKSLDWPQNDPLFDNLMSANHGENSIAAQIVAHQTLLKPFLLTIKLMKSEHHERILQEVIKRQNESEKPDLTTFCIGIETALINASRLKMHCYFINNDKQQITNQWNTVTKAIPRLMNSKNGVELMTRAYLSRFTAAGDTGHIYDPSPMFDWMTSEQKKQLYDYAITNRLRKKNNKLAIDQLISETLHKPVTLNQLLERARIPLAIDQLISETLHKPVTLNQLLEIARILNE